MIDLWTSLPGEVQTALIALGLFAASVLAGATANPFDNALVAWLRRQWAASRPGQGEE